MLASSRKRTASARDSDRDDFRLWARRKAAVSPSVDLSSPWHHDETVFSAPLPTHSPLVTYCEPGTPRPGPHLLQHHPVDLCSKAREAHEDVTTAVDASDRTSDGEEGAFKFLTFPAEIRNIIYEHAIHYPSCLDLYSAYYRQVAYADTLERRPEIVFRTPTLLLLSRRITAECLPILRSRTLLIDRLPPFCTVPKGSPGGFMKVTDFIGRETLQNLRHIDLRIALGEGPLCSGWIWERVLDEVLDVLSERNVFATMRLLIRRYGHTPGTRFMWESERKRYRHITKKRMPAFVQANPNVFKPHEVTVETWDIDGPRASFCSETLNGMPSETHDGHRLTRPDRMYPDLELFPSSILQFVGSVGPPPFPG